VRTTLPDEFANGDRDQWLAEFHKARLDQIGLVTPPQFLDEREHQVVAFLDARAVGEYQNACLPLHGVLV
jgi:hypothetical protein